MTLEELMKVITPVEKLKIIDFDTMETLYDNLYPIEILSLAGSSEVDLSEFTVKTIGSLLDWQRNTTFIVIMVRKVTVRYGE